MPRFWGLSRPLRNLKAPSEALHGFACILATGTAASTGTIQAVTSAFVYILAFLLVALDLRARRRGEASILGPRRGAEAPPRLLPVEAVARRRSA